MVPKLWFFIGLKLAPHFTKKVKHTHIHIGHVKYMFAREDSALVAPEMEKRKERAETREEKAHLEVGLPERLAGVSLSLLALPFPRT